MPGATRARAWRVSGASVQGASHKRSGLPNQDSLLTWTPGRFGPPAIVAVADGHGGSRHFRSATGSAFAVEAARVALNSTLPLLANGQGVAQAAQIDSIIRRLMVAEWRAMVAAHLAAHPCTDDELLRLGGGDAEDAATRASHNPIIAYGSTVLAGLLAHDTLVLVQLGDGDIVCVGPDGTAALGFERDDRHVGSVTTSLCQANAEDEVRVRVMALGDGDAPVLVCLSSDGYSNSFRTEEDFLRVGSDVLAHIESRGLGALTADLPTFLDEASTRGSGDDITIAILTRATDGTAPPVVAAGGMSSVRRESPPAGAGASIPATQRPGRPMAAAPVDVPPADGPAFVSAPRSVARSPIVIGLAVVIIVVATALLAARIPCASIPLMRPICGMPVPGAKDSVRADSTPAKVVPEKSAGEKTKGAGKAPAAGKKGNNPR